MDARRTVSEILHGARIAALSVAVLQMAVGPALASAAAAAPGISRARGPWGHPATPIKHVIVIIGENRSFDHVFATYQPRPGQTVHNLLSEGIIQLDFAKNAVKGPHFDKAQQLAATDTGPNDSFLLSPPKQEFPNNTLPAPPDSVATGAQGYFTNAACSALVPDPGACAEAIAEVTETGLPSEPGWPMPRMPTTSPTISHWWRVALARNRRCLINASATCVEPAGRPVPAHQQRACPTSATPPAPFTASTRCGSSSTAAPNTPSLREPLQAATASCSPGWK